MKRLILFFFAIAFATGCQDELKDIGIKGKEMGVEATVQIIGETDESHAWTNDDMIGVSIDGMSDYHSDTNVAFAYDTETGGFIPVKSGIILKGAERHLSAYYPFTGAENVIPDEIPLTTTVEFQTPEMMKANDYLFARTVATREDPVARFDFQHIMSQMKLVFEEAEGKTGNVTYTISGILNKGTFNPYTGEVRTTTTKSEDLTLSTDNMSSTLMLIPQTCNLAVSVTFEGKTYAGAFTADLKSNTCNTYTVTISPETIDVSLDIVDSGTSDWEVGEGGDITSEDIEVRVSADNSPATKAYTKEGFKTVFEPGDQLGVFAVKDGAIMPNVNNRPITFNGSAWTFDTKVNYNQAMKGAVFYAYWPYSEDFEPDLASEDIFTPMIKSWKMPYDQSGAKKYNQADIMTSSAEPAESAGKYILDFKMVHRMSMVSVSLPRTAFVFTNMDPVIEDYVLSSSSNASFLASIGDEPATELLPYLDKDSQSYRFIVRPGDAVSLNCTFNRDGQPKKFSINLPEGIAEGTCEPFKIDGGYKKTVMELKAGDYYCADGTLASYDPSKAAPDNVIGVIYMTGTPGSISGVHPDFTHGMVYSLARPKRPVVEGDPGKYSTFNEDEYVSVFGLKQDKNYDYPGIGLTPDDHKKSELNGYGYTRSWMKYDGEVGMNALFRASITAYRENTPLPEGLTTEWYLPSYDEFVMIATVEEALDASLAHASAELTFEGTAAGAKKYFRGYWTSSLRSTGAVVNYYKLGPEDSNNPDIKQTGYVESRYGYFRYAFAF